MNKRNPIRLEVRDLSKAFTAPVLKDINLTLKAGEIRGIVGENGAGKSTLLNILSGLLSRDTGSIMLDREDMNFANGADAYRHGVSIATQELSSLSTLNVAENLALRAIPSRYGWIDRAAINQSARAMIAKLGLDGVLPTMMVAELSLAERQLLEFGKAIVSSARLLILDEPTAALSVAQADRLHKLIHEQARRGTAILYVSHRLEDVRRECDTVSVMRDGRIVRTDAANAIAVDELIEEMSGRRLKAMDSRPRKHPSAKAVLVATEISTSSLPYPIELSLHAGEIVGLAGLAGAGRTELIEALFGLAPLRSGSVFVHDDSYPGGRKAIKSARDATAARMGLVTEDRKASGIFGGHSLSFNLILPSLIGRFRAHPHRIRNITAQIVESLQVRCSGFDQDIATLSGGNQQKILFGRWLVNRTRVLLLDDPGRGVDIATKTDILSKIREMADEGATVLIASSEIEELMSVCDRILVMSSRRIATQFFRSEWSEADILAAAFQEHVSGRPAVRP